jgi:hypothetical protein
MRSLKSLLLLLALALCAGAAHAQGFSYENFSGFASGHTLSACSGISGDCSTLVNSWFGTGTNMVSSTIQNSAGALTIQSTSACPGGDPPNHSGKYLDYSSTLGNGVNNQLAYLYWPASGASATSMGSVWFCSTIPTSASFGTTFDAVVVISGGGSRLSNYTSNGTVQGFDIETNGSQASIPYTPGNWVQVVWQFVAGTSCVNSNHSDCIRLQLYDINGNLIGQQWDSVPAGLPSYMTLGNINSASLPSGYHVQFADVKICTTGCSATEFPELQNPVPAWDGILTPGRGVDWTQAGFNGGVPPSASWTQCGSTLAPGSYTGAAITSTLAGCASNTYYFLAAGNFTISGQIRFPTSGKVALRGSGSNSTSLNFTGSGATCEQGSSLVCGVSADGTYTTEPPPIIYNWTAGYQQGTNQITLSGTSGISLTNPTMLMLDQCDTGLSSGAGCTSGSVVDNSNLYVCGKQYSSGTGCSADGPDAGGLRPNRGQMEIHTATNISGSVVTVSPPLIMPNWASGQTPQVWIVQPIATFGLENLTVNGSGASAQIGVEYGSAYHFWLSGVRIQQPTTWGFNCFQCASGDFVNSYVYGLDATPNPYGIRCSFCANNLFQNNVIQQATTPFSFDGSSSGNVVGYNFCIDALFSISTNTMQSCINKHAQNYYDLIEGNVAQQDNDDGIHGTGSMEVRFRNLDQGWESQPSNPKNAFTNAINDASYDRYEAEVANLLGTALYHTAGYQSTSCPNNNQDIYVLGTNCPSSVTIPDDSLTKSTSLAFANFDIFTGATRFCGNVLDTGWSTTCASTSESPVGAAVYPGFVPFHGDTAIGEPAFPGSLYLGSVRPGWWSSSIPYPANGPDVSSGSLGVCSGALNVVGQYDGMAAQNNSQCGGHGFTSSAWGGHANAIPAMAAYFAAGGPPDGSGSMLAINLAYSNPGGVTLTPSVAFGTVTQGTTSASMNVTVSNTSGSTISSLANSIPASMYSTDFTVTGTTCGSTLTNGSSCTITLTTTPTAAPSTLETATLQVTFTGFTGSPLTSALSVTSGSPGTVSLAPSSLSFGLVPQGSPSSGQALTLTNSSGSLISAITPSYTTDWSTLSTTCGSTLATGTSCTVTVKFTPSATPGTIESGTATITFTGASGSPVTASLSGTSGNPYIVQQHTSTNTPTIAYNPNVTAGNILVAHLTDYSEIATLSITDSQGNSWAVIQSQNLAVDGDTTAVLCATVSSTGPDTLTFLANGVGGDSFTSEIFEMSGHVCRPDIAVSDNHTGAAACGNGTLSITTTTPNVILVQGCSISGGGGSRVFTPGTGWANQIPNNGIGMTSYTIGTVQSAASPGTFSAGNTFSPATEEATVLVGFQSNAIAPPTPAPCPTCFAGTGTWQGTATKIAPVSVSLNGQAAVPAGSVSVTSNIVCNCAVVKNSSSLSCNCTAN